ncbi:MAG: VanZ family protein [Bacilli bacterium]|nr:VanZ family protein [Bacilli bacterium]
MKNKIISTLLVILWMLLIFIFSQQKADESLTLSDNVVKDTVNTVTNHSLSNDEVNNIVENTTVIVRKTAHFTLYLIFGILVANLFTNYKIKEIILISLLSCIIYAISDELHQLLVIGRTGRVLDVLIDSLGSLTGILIYLKIRK